MLLLPNGLYISDKLSDQEMFDLLSEDITLEELSARRIDEVQKKFKKIFSEYYTDKYEKMFVSLDVKAINLLKFSGYDSSPYSLTRSAKYGCDDKTDVRKQAGSFEHNCAVEAYYLVLKRLSKERAPEKRSKTWRQEMARKNRSQNKSKNR